MASTVLPNGIIVPEKFSRDWYADLYHNWQELDNLLGGGTPKDGTLTIQKNGDTVGTFSANQATDETINITVPDVNNGTLTIQKNGDTVGTFTANQATDETINISVPTKTSDLNNDSGFITGVSWNDVADKPSFATVATSGNYTDLSDKPTIPTVNNATLTIQQNGADIGTFSANQATDETINIEVPDALPTGSYIQFAGSQAPEGFLVCNGGEISRTTYSALFAVIGTTYGSGDGSTTFNLPNLIDRFLEGGSASGTVFGAGLPNITGFYDYCSNQGSYIGNINDNYGGAFFNRAKNWGDTISNGGGRDNLAKPGFDASLSNSIYGNSTTVQPPALTCLICIKY